MPEYKPDQCPDCGCEEFVKTESKNRTFTFDNSQYGYRFDQTDCISKYETMNCLNCDAEIDEYESIEQGKIVLADK